MDPPVLGHERLRFLVSKSWPFFFLCSPGRFIPKVWKCLFIYLSFVKKLILFLASLCSISSVQLLNRVWLFAAPWITACQGSLSITNSRVHPNSCALSWWCRPAISSSVDSFSSCPQSLPASESFPMSQLFTWGGQSIGVSASASVLLMNTQD